MIPRLIDALKQLETEKRISREIVLETLKAALAAAYKRDHRTEADVRVDINPETGEIRVFSQQIIEENGKEKITEIEVTSESFGRIATQTAKQVILQKIKEAERKQMYEEYIDREGEVVTGIIEQSDQRYTLVDLGRVEALLPPTEQIPTEKYEHGTRIKAYIVEVRKTTKEPQIVLSRTHPGLLMRLFELEVPEIYNGFVEIKAIAREAGHRSKVAVFSRDPSIDPIGACVGPKGSRVRMITSELRGEKIDIIEWNENAPIFVANSLSPAKVKEVKINEKEHGAFVIVPDNQLSLAIGKEGQNARLAAKLTGLRIDIKSESQVKEVEIEVKTETSSEQCQAITSSGGQCKAKAKPGSKYCGRHKNLEDKESNA